MDSKYLPRWILLIQKITTKYKKGRCFLNNNKPNTVYDDTKTWHYQLNDMVFFQKSLNYKNPMEKWEGVLAPLKFPTILNWVDVNAFVCDFTPLF